MANFKEFGDGRAVSPMCHNLETYRHILQHEDDPQTRVFMDKSNCNVHGLAAGKQQKMVFRRLVLGILSGLNADYILMAITHRIEHVVSDLCEF